MKNLVILGCVVSTLSLNACQPVSNSSTRGAVAIHQPTTLDPALAVRGNNWQPTYIDYASGDVIAGPTLFPYEPDESADEWQQGLIAPILFVGQAVISPVMAFVVPAWAEVRYEGADTPPTHVGTPPLPPTNVPVAAAAAEADALERPVVIIDAQTQAPAAVVTPAIRRPSLAPAVVPPPPTTATTTAPAPKPMGTTLPTQINK